MRVKGDRSAYTLKGQEIAQLIAHSAESNLKIVAGSRVRLPARFQKDDAEVLVLSLDDCTEVQEYSPQDQVITVDCGIQLGRLNEFLSHNNQWFPVSYGTQSTTLLDAIIYGECGFLENLFGGPRRLVLGMTAALSNGNLIRMGGRVVKNVSGYDLTRLFIGSLGIFGIPVSANLRLFAQPQSSCTLALFHHDLSYFLEKTRELITLGLSLSCLTLVDFDFLISSNSPASDLSQLQPLAPFCLLIRLCDSEQVVEDTKNELLTFANGLAAVEHKILSEQDLPVWTALYELKNTHVYPKIDIEVPSSIVLAWWQKNKFRNIPFLYNPGLGHLTFFPSKFDEQRKILEQLEDFATDEKQPLTVSFVDESSIRRTKHLAGNTIVQAQLLHSLKKRFDPSGCLNPFVEIF